VKLNQLRGKIDYKTSGAVAVLVIATAAMTAPAAMAAIARPLAAHAPASAEFTSMRKSVTIPAGNTTFRASESSARFTVIRSARQAQSAISCTLTAETPVFETTTNEEEGIANIDCTQAVSELYVAVGLQKNGVLVSSSSNEDYSSNYVAAFTFYGRSPGTYETLSYGEVCTSSCTTGYADSPSVYLP
jgi:hypothetical protein